jgi:hypothetical protein
LDRQLPRPAGRNFRDGRPKTLIAITGPVVIEASAKPPRLAGFSAALGRAGYDRTRQGAIV